MQIQGTGEIRSTKRKFHLSGVPLIERRLYICRRNRNKVKLNYKIRIRERYEARRNKNAQKNKGDAGPGERMLLLSLTALTSIGFVSGLNLRVT